VHLPTDGIPLVDFQKGSVLGRHKYMAENNAVNHLILKGTTTIGTGDYGLLYCSQTGQESL